MANVICNAGKAITAARLIGNSQPVPSFCGWGTGAGTSAATDTALFTEATEARVTATMSNVTTTVTNDTAQYVATMTCAGAGKTITNMGLLDASTAGNLFFHADFTGVALNVGDSIQGTFKVQQS